MKSFELVDFRINNLSYIDRWIEFIMSRNVENISLNFRYNVYGPDEFTITDCFYNNPSVKQLRVELFLGRMKPKCSVSWTSLKIDPCILDEESFAKILSGSPILETLILSLWGDQIRVLDLSKSMRLKTLEIEKYSFRMLLPTHINKAATKLTSSKGN
ncbi:putative F-box protein [Cardamine amara subsp. amara]|uniref:F-box protein n=1 Tax=Cardamine amara subsp. amara TaxID=228776 RepID=A0ABD0ZC46_CARAN